MLASCTAAAATGPRKPSITANWRLQSRSTMVASSRKGAASTVGTARAGGGAHQLWAPPPQTPSRSTFFFVDHGGVCRDVPQTHRTEASWDLRLRRMFRIDCNKLDPIDCCHPLLVRETHYSPSTSPWMAALEVPPPSLGAVRYSGSDVLGRILGGEVLAYPDLHCNLLFRFFFELALHEMIHWEAKCDHNAALFESQRERVRAVATKIYLVYGDGSHGTAPVPFVFASLISNKRANAPGMLIGGQLDTEHAWPLGGVALRKLKVLLNNFGLDSEFPELVRAEGMDATFGHEFPVAWVPHFDHVCPDGTLVPGTQEPVLVPLLRGTRLSAEVSPWLSLRDHGTLNAIRSNATLSAWCLANLGADSLNGSAPTASVAASTPTTKQTYNPNPHRHSEDTGARSTCPTDPPKDPPTAPTRSGEEGASCTTQSLKVESERMSELETLRSAVAKLHTRNRELEATPKKTGHFVVTHKRTDIYFTGSGPSRQTVVLHAPTGRMTIGDYQACRGSFKIVYSHEASGASTLS